MKRRKCCNHRCPVSVYFHTLLLIMYLSAIETLICRRKMSLIGSIPPVLHKYDTRFSKYRIELIVALSSTRNQNQRWRKVSAHVCLIEQADMGRYFSQMH